MGEEPQRTPSPGRTLWTLVLSSTLCFLSIGSYAAVLPGFLLDDGGLGPGQVGVAMGVTAAVAIVLRPLAGAIGDRRGRRATALLGGVVLAAGPLVLIGPGGLLLVIGARALMGAGDALVNTATMAWVVDTAPEERRGRAMATFGMSIWLGLALGPQWAVLVRDAWGYDAVWLVAAGAALLAGLVTRLLPAPTAVRPGGDARVRVRLPRGAVLPGIVMVLASFGNGVFEAFGVVHLVGRGLPDEGGPGGAASVFTVVAVTTFLARFAGGALCDRVGPRPVAVGGVVVAAAAYAVLAVAASFAVAAVAAVLLGVGLALLYPSLGLMATRRVPAADRGAGVGVFTAFMDLAFGLGAVLGGLVAAVASIGAALGVGVVVALAALPVLVLTSDPAPAAGAGAEGSPSARPSAAVDPIQS
ncbi:MFS transporter [Patulibacter sp. S7RM1-6]